MPKLNPLDGEEIRRNSPANTPVGLNPTSVSIKQEKLDAGLHPNMPDIMTVSKILFFVLRKNKNLKKNIFYLVIWLNFVLFD